MRIPILRTRTARRDVETRSAARELAHPGDVAAGHGPARAVHRMDAGQPRAGCL